jgi:hypothetical protein
VAFKKITYLFLFLCFLSPVVAQDKGTGPKEKSFQSERKLRKLERKEAREKRKKEKAERKAIKKHHKRIQTKDVQKRMKKSRKRAIRNNDNKREFFLKRWFQKKKKV